MPGNAVAPMSIPPGKKNTSMMPMIMPGMMMHGATTTPTPMPSGATPLPVQTGSAVTPTGTTLPSVPATEESYVENILRMNLGKVATLYMTYENNSEWNAKIFKGVLEAAGRDHIIISDPKTGRRYLLLTLNLDYITFDEPLNYTLPFGTTGAARF
ncbi:spore coat protein GerQ [Cohnella terricola]|uniref:Spore coat protein GerQ n=2 Tax=Cohnella terricola TaxID=1289167 RepID=A0A559JG00_9BACL|nr:spore coat protein GerQ [Cohnella terricola]